MPRFPRGNYNPDERDVDERVDGRELVELDEPGSDAQLLRGLLLVLAAEHADDER
jgi:hypothetical protein